MGAHVALPLRHVAADLSEIVLVCRKCSKKLDGGFGPHGDQKLAKSLRRALADRNGPRDTTRRPAKRKGPKARFAVVEVDCLDLCPRGAVVALRADRPGHWLLVPEGAAMGAVIDTLGLAGGLQTKVP